jgi:hypothetical protein
MVVDPRELTAGYSFANRSLGTARGVLRDGDKVVWTCEHKPHGVPTVARQCAEAELERRLQGAQVVLQAGHCVPCAAFWDLGLAAGETEGAREPSWQASALMRGICPRCSVPFTRVTVAVLERTVR